MRSQSKNGGFLGALVGLLTKTILPTVAKFVPKVLGPLATGALSGLASTGIGKLFGNGMVTIPSGKKQALLGSHKLTLAQRNKMIKSKGCCPIKLTKQQQQDGGFLGMLASLGIPLIGSLISGLTGKGLQVGRKGKGLRVDRGKGLQVDSQIRPYRSIPFIKK